MKRIVGILLLVLVLYGVVMASNSTAFTLQNHQRLAERLGLYGILTLGAGVLIISGGIDLSIGSVYCLGGIGLALLIKGDVSPWAAVAIVLAGGLLIGLFHGALVTRLGLQPFIVTLCGLFIFRGLAQWLALPDPTAPLKGLLRFVSAGYFYGNTVIEKSSAGNVGFGTRATDLTDLTYLSTGYLGPVPVRLLLFLAIAGVIVLLLHFSVYGRYLYAIGANEQAARYAGVATNRYKVLAYMLCALTAVMAGMLDMLALPSFSPTSDGQFYELYAITGAVLGGCSLRGGEGTVVGMVLGAAVLPLLRNLCNFSDIPEELEFTVIGLALLLGTIADELLKRRASRVAQRK
jgi:ribose transport system permease protein